MKDKGKNDAVNTEAVRRAEIKKGKRPMVQSTENFDSDKVRDPISDSQILNMNRAIIRAEAYKEANDLWLLGKSIGMKSQQKDDEIVKIMVDMEERDKSQQKGGLIGNLSVGGKNVS